MNNKEKEPTWLEIIVGAITMIGILVVFVALFFFTANGFQVYNYYECTNCRASCKQRFYQIGLPFQFKYECGFCGSKLRKITKEQSKWDDSRGINGYGR